MKKYGMGWKVQVIAIVLVLAGAFAAFLGYMRGGPAAFGSAQTTPITLDNPGLEAPYPPYEGTGELKVANGWRPWWSGRRPEYLPFSDLVHGGELSQKVFTTYSAQDAGIYQIVSGVTPGQWYTFKAWVYPQSENDGGKGSAMVCVNPWGNWDPTHRTTVCGQEIPFGTEGWQEPYGEWYQVEVTAQAWTDTITVFTRYVAEHAVRWNDAFWDDMSLEQVTIGGECPTPAPVTPVPCATVGPVPTGTPGECATLGEIEELLRGMEWGVR